MFFQEPKLPNELILNIINRLPLKDATSLLFTSTEMQAFIKDTSVWRKFGALDFENFVKRIQPLPYKYQRLILEEKYSLSKTETLIKTLKLLVNAHYIQDPLKRGEEVIKYFSILMSIPDFVALTNKFPELVDHDQETMSQYVRIFNGLSNGIATPKELIEFNYVLYPFYLMSDNGQIALNEGLITLKQAKIFNPAMLNILFSKNGLDALREKLITIEQAHALITDTPLSTAITSSHAKLFTDNESKVLTHATFTLMILTSDNGIMALREKLITPDLGTKMSAEDLNQLINDKISEFQANTSSPPTPPKNI